MISVPTGGFGITDYVNQAFDTIASNFKPGSNAGCMYADYLRDVKLGAYKKEVGISTTIKAAATHDEIALDLDKRLAEDFSKRTTEYNVPLDKWLTHGYIRKILAERCGYKRLEDVNMAILNGVIRAYPWVALPMWEDISMEDY